MVERPAPVGGGEPVAPEWLSEAEDHDVLGIRMPVLGPTEVMITKLMSLTEQYCDFGALLPHARAVREQIDWPRMRAVTADHPYAEAFVHLLDNLQISDPAGVSAGLSERSAGRRSPGAPRARVAARTRPGGSR